MKTYDIRFVAIYLRKSRGDEETDLQKHRNTLVDMCEKNKWKYVEYAEIGTSDSIEMRPKFSRLLDDIEKEVFDAILVVAYDRLSRGDKEEQGRIERILKKSNTLIITPMKVYDLNNDADDTYSNFQSLLAREEYKSITRRLRQGKIAGAKMGNWTNGIPPYPYEYQKWNDKFNEKGLVVNDEKLKVYRYIIERAMENVSPQTICVDLNKKNILSPKGRKWSNVAIYRLLVDETHLGKIITNKTEGDGHKIKKSSAKNIKILPRSEWNIVDNCHQAVKTQLEHDTILELINKRQKTPKRARAGVYELSGLIKCGICGYGATFQKKANGYILIKPCWHSSDTGEKCKNRGGSYKDVLNTVKSQSKEHIKSAIKFLQQNNNDSFDKDIIKLKRDIKSREKEYEKYILALDKVNEAYELGDYSREDWLKRKEKWSSLIFNIKNEIDVMERKIIQFKSVNPEDKIKYYKDLYNRLDGLDTQELNSIYKELIKSIKWTREGEEAQIEIEFN